MGTLGLVSIAGIQFSSGEGGLGATALVVSVLAALVAAKIAFALRSTSSELETLPVADGSTPPLDLRAGLPWLLIVAATGAGVGALIGGPVGAAVGAVLGAMLGALGAFVRVDR